jgi:hypothetical protein
MDFISVAVGFVAGAFTAAAGNYLGTKFTDKRKLKESSAHKLELWKDLEQRFPQVILEMKTDVQNPELTYVREFFTKSSRTSLNVSAPCFQYHTDVHADLSAAMAYLQELGYVEDITTGNCPNYRMKENFVDLLRLS